uniref:ATP synthase F0 subunit 8 n=1 Tax=Carinata recurvata TaxID=3110982 RepID=UPI002E76EB93|nr:ATP synthase F0 subunit 8 [Carinata recurvata]WRH31299.1 ATP synthase F0 subunit 8 [Carinata recurvata]
MPQMSPMWWVIMFLIFILCFLIMNSMIYFNYLINNTNINKLGYSNLTWKW